MIDQFEGDFDEEETHAEFARKIILVALVCAMVMVFFLGM